MTETVRSWRILDENVPTLDKLIARLNRKAVKHGLMPMLLTLGGTSIEHDKNGIDVYIMREVTVRGDTPRMNGWQFVATIEHAGEAGNILRTIPTLDPSIALPEKYRTASPGNCDHCRQFRRRNDTFVVYHEVKGWAQVGRNCLADFLGTDAVASKMTLAEIWSLIEDTCHGAREFGYGGGIERAYDLETLLQYAAQIVITEGWVSRAKAEEMGKPATADLTLSLMNKAKASPNDPRYQLTPAAYGLAVDALAWAPSWIERELARPNASDYVWNMRVILASPYVKPRGVGLAVSLLGAYMRDQEMQAKYAREREGKADSQHVGTVGKRQEFADLTVTSSRQVANNFGVTTVLNFVDTNGNVLVWFATGYFEVSPGDRVTLVASVKAHSEYRGIKQTVITRGKVK